LLLKATKVSGVFTADPVKDPDARRYTSLSYDQVLTDKLAVMDATAVVMCRENDLPLRVFNVHDKGDLLRIVNGEDIGTLVTAEAECREA
jgi:uridylate kinase